MKFDDNDFQTFSYEGADYKTMLTDKFRQHQPYTPDDPNKITAQIPGTILKILVKEGQQINPAKCLFILEAMKMKNKVFATVSGQIIKIYVSEGQIVTNNQLLLELGEPELVSKKKKEPKPKKEKETKNKKDPKDKKIKKADEE
jgi:acetyl/propionyl-CoA carboxylase alpha subunit